VERASKERSMTFLISALLASVAALAAPPSGAPHAAWDFSAAGAIPVQSGGRVKPLDSLAAELALFVTGRRQFEGWHPTDLLVSWIADPRSWEDKAFIQVGRVDVRRQLGLDEARSRFTPAELFQNFALAQYADRMGTDLVSPPKGGLPPGQNPRERELRAVLDRLGTFRALVSGQGWLLIPSEKPEEAWASLAAPNEKSDERGKPVRKHFADMLHAYLGGDAARFDQSARATRGAITALIPGWGERQERLLKAETAYNRIRPYRTAWILYLLATLAWVLSGALRAGPRPRGVTRIAQVLTFAAFAVHVGGTALRCYIAGRPPVTNMYESVNWVGFGVLLFGAILYFLNRQAVPLVVGCALAALGLLYADNSPAILDPSIQPLVPVLRSNYWLTIHVLTITLGYAAFFLALGIADVTLFHFIRERLRPGAAGDLRAKVVTLNLLTYRALQFGVVLLAAGTILGGVWADYSWGRFWGWDPKETWALIALLCYVGILHARFTGWVRDFGFAAWTVVASLSVMMAWYGVNFVLGVGLHSYGFASGGLGPVIAFVALHLLYVGVAAGARRLAAPRATPPAGGEASTA
jgi:cytochrome c-type biogenesis protein CcsB